MRCLLQNTCPKTWLAGPQPGISPNSSQWIAWNQSPWSPERTLHTHGHNTQQAQPTFLFQEVKLELEWEEAGLPAKDAEVAKPHGQRCEAAGPWEAKKKSSGSRSQGRGEAACSRGGGSRRGTSRDKDVTLEWPHGRGPPTSPTTKGWNTRGVSMTFAIISHYSCPSELKI